MNANRQKVLATGSERFKSALLNTLNKHFCGGLATMSKIKCARGAIAMGQHGSNPCCSILQYLGRPIMVRGSCFSEEKQRRPSNAVA